MNNLLTESFERITGRYPGEEANEGNEVSPDVKDRGMKGFFKQVEEIEKEIDRITSHLDKLQSANEESKHTTKASSVKEIKQRMEKDVEEVKIVALKIKTKLEQLDRDNLMNRQKSGCGKGTGVDRSRIGMTVALKKRLKERMTQFQILRQNIENEYREVVERRIFTVTGTRPDDETVEKLIETGNSEQIFQKAIQGHGRGQIMDTVAEIQERHDSFLEVEKKLVDLQQMFLDMSVLVDAQGDLLDDIEAQVNKSVDHVEKARVALQEAKKVQKNTRKYMCFAIIILLIVIIIALGSIMKKASSSTSQ